MSSSPFRKVVEFDLPVPIAMLKPVNGILVRDWKQDIIQLVQFPRTHTVVSPSPFALKLETWIRMNNLQYRNVSNDFNKASAKGQIPFIELNGRQFADSNFIIEHLRSEFKLPIDGHLSTGERAQLRAFSVLIEESLFRCLQYYRSKDFGWLATDKGYLSLMPGYQKFLFQKLFIKQLQNRIKKISQAQGYGRHSLEEIDEISKKDLMALSTFLGDKIFMFGDSPTTLDATLFGTLVQFTDTPLKSDAIKPFIEKSTPNLHAFVQRMKDRYWPDWAKIIEHLALNPEDLLPKEETVTVTASPPPATTTTTPAPEGTTVQAQG